MRPEIRCYAFLALASRLPAKRTWAPADPIFILGSRFASAVAAGKLYVMGYFDKEHPEADRLPSLYEYPPVP